MVQALQSRGAASRKPPYDEQTHHKARSTGTGPIRNLSTRSKAHVLEKKRSRFPDPRNHPPRFRHAWIFSGARLAQRSVSLWL
ncbi:hypothetical protein HYPDE_39348 [Hyphomicrobium denitrificans 1NES1]|uniref:Uncharacterized protein n=1 Tax=Hyphomicrobium denitrificans 1NES1 TaxID=670307 RepID=N0B930_9HYPH|nr:hypothetical protein HYPDE_39348 [Hyphomicrobium denitrificans 1NES1]